MKSEEKEREVFLRMAGQLYDEMVSRAGVSGDRFDDIEEQALAACRELALEFITARLSAEEEAGPEVICCPKCDRKMRRPKSAPRNLDTFIGTVHYERRHAICDGCGHSFSPSGPLAGDSAAGGVEPSDPQGL